jgi:iron complex outermembrane receptor protein
VYNNIRSAEPGPAPLFIPITLGNDVKGETYGVELSANYQLTSWWNIRSGYTFLKKDLTAKPGTVDLNKATAESDDPEHQVLVQSNVDLPGRIELGTVIRYVGKLPNPYVPAYTALDIRIGCKLSKAIELNIVGQNLLDQNRLEFIPASPARREIERSIYGKVTCRF